MAGRRAWSAVAGRSRLAQLCSATRVVLFGALLSAGVARALPAAQKVLDPDQLVRDVLARNPELVAQGAVYDAAAAHLGAADAFSDPTLSYMSAPATIGIAMGYRQSVQISQHIPWPGTLRLRRAAASAEASSARYQVSDLRLKLAAEARAAYAQWYYVHRAITINRAGIALVQRLRDVARAAYGAGQKSQQDVLQADVELVRLQNQALELKRRRHVVQAKINTLLDVSPERPVAAPASLPARVYVPRFADLRQAALVQYPALRGLRARVRANRVRVRLARKALYPSFTFFAGENTFMSPAPMQPDIGLSLNIPIGGRHEGEAEEAHAKLRKREADFIVSRAHLLDTLERSFAAVKQARASLALYKSHLVPLSKLSLKTAEADYGAGTGDFHKLINAEEQLLLVKLERVRTRADLYTRLAALDYETGGAIFSATEEKP